MTIHVPKNTSLNLTSVIKPVFDGIMAACSRHDGSEINLVAERLATALDIDQKDLICLLGDKTMAILGARKLVRPRGSGLQWNPNDDLLVANELSLADYASEQEWELSGELPERFTKPRQELTCYNLFLLEDIIWLIVHLIYQMRDCSID